MAAPSRSRRKAAVAFLAALFAPRAALAQTPPLFGPVDGGPYVPTPQLVVERMLELAKVGPGDTVYDLGSGDGRLVIEAARRHGARGVGIERVPHGTRGLVEVGLEGPVAGGAGGTRGMGGVSGCGEWIFREYPAAIFTSKD